MAVVDATVTRTPAGDALTELILRVTTLSALFTMRGEDLARPAGQTLARWIVLDTAETAPHTVAEIGRYLGLTRQSVQRVADLLVRDKLAVYVDNPAHRRAHLLRPTEQGLRVLRAIRLDQKAWADWLGAEVGEEPLRALTPVLDRAIELMTADRQRRRRTRSTSVTSL